MLAYVTFIFTHTHTPSLIIPFYTRTLTDEGKEPSKTPSLPRNDRDKKWLKKGLGYAIGYAGVSALYPFLPFELGPGFIFLLFYFSFDCWVEDITEAIRAGSKGKEKVQALEEKVRQLEQKK
jgi:hypothetical protein